jgi:hypothetical protein
MVVPGGVSDGETRVMKTLRKTTWFPSAAARSARRVVE